MSQCLRLIGHLDQVQAGEPNSSEVKKLQCCGAFVLQALSWSPDGNWLASAGRSCWRIVELRLPMVKTICIYFGIVSGYF